MLFDHCALSWGVNHWIQRQERGYRALYQGVFPFVSNSLDLGISASMEWWRSAGGKCHQGSLWCHYAPGPCWGLSWCSGSSQVAERCKNPIFWWVCSCHFASLGLESVPWFGICCQLWGRTPHTAVSELPFTVLRLLGSLLLIQCLLGELPWIFVPHLLLASPSPLHYFIWESYFFFCKLASD